MLGGGMGVLWTAAALLVVVSAGPLSRFPREAEDYQNIDLSAYANYTANEVCFSEGEVFQKGDVMPNPGPCEECRCEPPSIVCQMVRCPVNNNGCKTIQKPNHCCPDYKCECDYNNQLYGDGERIDLPEDPCQVCYCKGGEVMCTSLKCYLRDDCEPQHVTGQCCPKYENCPIRGGNWTNGEDKSIRSSNKTSKREMQPWLLTKVAVQTPSMAVPRRSEAPTTEGSNVVIVSDWLSERQTTPEDTAQHNRVLNNTNGGGADELTTQQLNLDGSVIVRKSGTIAPLDEVIFTRIDMLRDREQDNQEPSSSAPEGTSEENDVTVTTDLMDTTISDVFEEMTTTHEEAASLGQVISSDNRINVEGISTGTNENHLNSATVYINLAGQTDSEVTSVSPATNPKEEILTNAGNSKMNSSFGPNQTPIKQVIHDIEKDNPDLFIINDSTQSTLQDIITILNDQVTNNDVQEFQESEETTDDLISVIQHKEDQSPGTNYDMNVELAGKVENYISTTTENYRTTPDQEAFTAKEDIIDNSLGESNIDAEAIGLRDPLNTETRVMDLNGEGFTSLEAENTTPYFTEDHMVQSEVGAAKLQDTTNLKTTLYPEFTTEPGVPETTVYKLDLKNGGTDYNDDGKALAKSKKQDKYIESSPTTIIGSSGRIEDELKHQNIVQPAPNTQNTHDVESSTSESIESREELEEQKPNSLDDIQLSSFNKTNDNVSDATPVLELNSHVPFLHLGGHDSSETSNEYLYTTTAKTENKGTYTSEPNYITDDGNTIMGSSDLTTKSNEGAELNTYHGKLIKEEMREYTSDNYEDTTSTTSHILLTPEDLKVLAEYLINDTIKPIVTKNNSVHDGLTQTWLQGNLTYDEKIVSILSAANVSIGFMNKTKLEETKNLDSVIAEKFDKDTVFKGNSILDNGNDVINKKNYLYNKLNIKSDLLKNGLKSPTKSPEGPVALKSTNNDVTSTEAVTSTQRILENILSKNLSENESYIGTVFKLGLDSKTTSERSPIKGHNDSLQISSASQESTINTTDQLRILEANENKTRLDNDMSQSSVTNKENKTPSRVERISYSEGIESTSDSSLGTDLQTPDDLSQEPLVIP